MPRAVSPIAPDGLKEPCRGEGVAPLAFAPSPAMPPAPRVVRSGAFRSLRRILAAFDRAPVFLRVCGASTRIRSRLAEKAGCPSPIPFDLPAVSFYKASRGVCRYALPVRTA